MQVIREEQQRRSGANMFINGGVAKNNRKNGGEKVRMRRLSKFTNPVLMAATAAAIMFLSAATFAAGQEPGGLLLQGNGPGPAANEAGPGCNIIPPLASIGTKVNIKQFPPADSLTDAELAGPVQLLKSGKFDIPIEKLIKVNVPPGTPRGTITLPLFKGAVNTRFGLKPVWYIILDAGDKEEAERLGVNFSKKLHNAGDAARPATLRDDGTFLFESGLVDFSPNRQVQAGSKEKPFPPSIAIAGSVGDADYSPLVRANGIVYDAPVIAAAVDDAIGSYQRAVIGIADRACNRDTRGKRFFLRAGLDLPVWTEVYKAGFEEERPVVAKRGGPCGIASVMQFFREVNAQALRFFFVACIEDDVPHGLQTEASVHRTLEQGQRDRSSGGTGGNIHLNQLFDRYVELA